MEQWRRSWRNVAPSLPTRGLEALRLALLRDDPALVPIQTIVTKLKVRKFLFFRLARLTVIGGCAIGYAVWKGATHSNYHRIFDSALSRLSSAKSFTLWFDNKLDPRLSRQEIFAALLPEVNLELARRAGQLYEVPTEKKECENGTMANNLA